MNKHRYYLILALVAGLVLALAVGAPLAAQQGFFDVPSNTIIHGTLRVQGATTNDSTLTQTGAATFAGGVTVSGSNITASDNLTVTNLLGRGIMVQAMTANGDGAAQTVTPTASIVELSGQAVTITVGVITGGNGQIVHFTNDSNVTMLFPDSGQLLGGARSLTQYDTLTLMQIAGAWREISFVQN